MTARLLVRKEQLRALGLRICESQPQRVAAWKAADDELRAIIDASPLVPTDAEFLAAEASVKAQVEVVRAKQLVQRILDRMASLTARCKAEAEEAPACLALDGGELGVGGGRDG